MNVFLKRFAILFVFSLLLFNILIFGIGPLLLGTKIIFGLKYALFFLSIISALIISELYTYLNFIMEK